MELEDRMTITAPEGVELQIVLAGAGSRLIAGAIDLLLQALLVGLAALVALDLVGGGLGLALFAMAAFVGLYLYDVLFEVLASGRTPGKRFTHLRVVREKGAPVDLPASATRNLLRLIDILPGAY
ncbi:MAG: RDD family protein, partial [Actinomycetota bacterium]|nr:RDD family protein [Actinomycetota bacterium]